MKNKLLFLIIVIELFSLVLIKPIKNKVYRYSTNVFKSSNLNNEKLENYVIGVVAAEMPASFSFEEGDMGSQAQLNGLGNSYILILVDGKSSGSCCKNICLQ